MCVCGVIFNPFPTIRQERLQEALATENRPSTEKVATNCVWLNYGVIITSLIFPSQPTHNPLAPEGYTEPNEKNYGTEKVRKMHHMIVM